MHLVMTKSGVLCSLGLWARLKFDADFCGSVVIWSVCCVLSNWFWLTHLFPFVFGNSSNSTLQTRIWFQKILIPFRTRHHYNRLVTLAWSVLSISSIKSHQITHISLLVSMGFLSFDSKHCVSPSPQFPNPQLNQSWLNKSSAAKQTFLATLTTCKHGRPPHTTVIWYSAIFLVCVCLSRLSDHPPLIFGTSISFLLCTYHCLFGGFSILWQLSLTPRLCLFYSF